MSCRVMDRLLGPVQSFFFAALVVVWAISPITSASPHHASIARSNIYTTIERRDREYIDNASIPGKAIYCIVAMVGVGLLFYCASE
jgi:hypothetical protein